MKNNMEEKLGTGAKASKKDKRNVQYSSVAFATTGLVKGGIIYKPEDIDHQHQVGICTAISRTQLRTKQTGRKYSPEFQYLLQKKFYDQAWFEGSSVLVANKVAKKYGFLPAVFWTATTEQDRYLPYSKYIEKLKAISDDEINVLLKLCIDPIAGYAQVDVTDAQAIAKAINDSQAGLLCRYGCQKNWWTPSWKAKDINPLKWAPETSGHAIINSYFDYSDGKSMQKLANTWGPTWCLEGSADINWDNYKMNEAFVDLLENPMFKFTKTMKLYDKNDDVKELQKRLQVLPTSGWFGPLTKRAVVKYQLAHNLVGDGIVGPLTIKELNK